MNATDHTSRRPPLVDTLCTEASGLVVSDACGASGGQEAPFWCSLHPGGRSVPGTPCGLRDPTADRWGALPASVT